MFTSPRLMLGVAVALSGCVAVGSASADFEPSPAALAALPPGVDPGFLIRDENGCYGIVIEVTPEGRARTGPALLDDSGQQVCDV